MRVFSICIYSDRCSRASCNGVISRWTRPLQYHTRGLSLEAWQWSRPMPRSRYHDGSISTEETACKIKGNSFIYQNYYINTQRESNHSLPSVWSWCVRQKKKYVQDVKRFVRNDPLPLITYLLSAFSFSFNLLTFERIFFDMFFIVILNMTGLCATFRTLH